MTFGSKSSDAPVRRRTQGRLKVRLPARIDTLSATHSAILENISRKGAKLVVEAPPKCGSNAVLRWDKYEAFGTISWVSGTRCGVLFASGLSEEPLRATLSLDEVTAMSDDTGFESLAAREWVEGSARSGFG